MDDVTAELLHSCMIAIRYACTVLAVGMGKVQSVRTSYFARAWARVPTGLMHDRWRLSLCDEAQVQGRR